MLALTYSRVAFASSLLTTKRRSLSVKDPSWGRSTDKLCSLGTLVEICCRRCRSLGWVSGERCPSPIAITVSDTGKCRGDPPPFGTCHDADPTAGCVLSGGAAVWMAASSPLAAAACAEEAGVWDVEGVARSAALRTMAGKRMKRGPDSDESIVVTLSLMSVSNRCAGSIGPEYPRRMADVIPLEASNITSRSSLMARVFACLRSRSATDALLGSSEPGSYVTPMGSCLARTTKGAGLCSRLEVTYSLNVLASPEFSANTRNWMWMGPSCCRLTTVFCSLETLVTTWSSTSRILAGVPSATFPSPTAATKRFTAM
mmetsp:Transcript_11680/g.30218  ORF Transcript_11680/g.30218 Transcript_11680/m.30218 type:complete len:315 (+) Transcript_11680:434-1378(+)